MMHSISPREQFRAALECRPPAGRVPTFELEYFPTMEAFGKVHPRHRQYAQWEQMRASERNLHREEIARLYLAVAERFDHSAILLHANPPVLDEHLRLISRIRELAGSRYFLMLHGDATFGIPPGGRMEQFCLELADCPAKLKDQAGAKVDAALARAEKLRDHGGLDGFALCADYCFNSGPFVSPAQFAEFIAPYLARLVAGYRALGFYAIKHTDGNIMPILDQLLQARPHALHSLDPQGGVDLAEVKRLTKGEVCLIGNVNCGLLQTGTEAEVAADVRRALRDGMPGGGYIFSTSNCVYTGMPLERYELMLDIWRREGDYRQLV